MRVYFDASVVITAMLSSSGGSALLLEYVKLRTFVGITSQTIVDEVIEKAAKIGKSVQDIETFIADSGLLVRKRITRKESQSYQDLLDIEDAHVVAGAILTRCDSLVTLDKRHLLRREVKEKYKSLHFVTPKELLQDIISKR